MAPAVIADSDDDDESSYSPPAKSPARPDIDPTRSHDPVDRSGSTDSAFFRSVLDEQSAAARNCARILQQAGDVQTASGSFDAPTMMSTDPLQGHEGDASQGRVELPTEIANGGVDDPWEVPSSPEVGHGSAIARRKPGSRTKDTAEESSGQSSKRRKIESLSHQTQDSDGIDLVQLPPIQHHDEDAAFLPTKTAPTSSKGQLPRTIGNALTNSQMEAYQIFPGTGPTQISQDQGPARHDNAIVRSSSSATNVNTPRSDLKISRNMDTILEKEQLTPEKVDSWTPVRQWNSSPDENSAPQPTSDTPANKRKRGKTRKSPTLSPQDEVMVHELDAKYEEPDTVYQEIKDDESDYEEKDITVQKPKKPRGRPKKNADATPATDPAKPTSHDAEGRSVTKTKKKRGRPKKAEQQAVEDVKEEVAAGTRVDAEAQEVAKQEDKGGSTYEETTADPVSAESDPQAQEQAVSESVGMLKEEPSSDRKRSKDTGQVEVQDETKPTKSAAKTPTPAIPTSASKPIYRVGLSKRSRIAPLLKIRK